MKDLLLFLIKDGNMEPNLKVVNTNNSDSNLISSKENLVCITEKVIKV